MHKSWFTGVEWASIGRDFYSKIYKKRKFFLETNYSAKKKIKRVWKHPQISYGVVSSFFLFKVWSPGVGWGLILGSNVYWGINWPKKKINWNHLPRKICNGSESIFRLYWFKFIKIIIFRRSVGQHWEMKLSKRKKN